MIGLVTIEAASFAYRAWAHRVTVGSAAVPTRSAQDVGSPEITVVVLGESSARGVPYCRGQNQIWLSVGHILEWQLSRDFPDRKIRVQILAEDGVTLEGALRKLDVLPNRPDAVILLSGHNEISGRFPLERRVPHYADEMTWRDHISGWVRSVSPLDNLIQEGLDAQAKGIHPRREDQRLIDVPACTAAEFARIRDDFRSRLDGFLTYCRRSGALPILIIPPGNDGGFEPNRSVLDPSLPRAERDALGRMFTSIRAAENAEPSRCRMAYEALLARHPGFADAHFRLARLFERAGDYGEANRHYLLARDLDGLPTRCLTAYEEIYRAAAGRGDCILVDGPAVLRKITPHGIINGQVLHDAQHPALISYVALATDLLEQLQRRGAFGWPRGMPVPTVDPAHCAEHFGMDSQKWSHVCYYSKVMWHGSRSYRYDDSERRAIELSYTVSMYGIAAGVPPERYGLLGLLKIMPP